MSLHVQGVEILYGGLLPRERGFRVVCFVCVCLFVCLFVGFFFDERRTGMMIGSRYDDDGMR